MENRNSLIEYLKKSHHRRQNIINLANDIFDKVVKEETKCYKPNTSFARENGSTYRNRKITLEPLANRKSQPKVVSYYNTFEAE
ncbi:hypothetical protein SteCoe_27219 [Stentor coeruleus]|uniref:Uncharacterized protein n=1 Tax=Stentor coeruleus TaxID=5963 RepID=A0A1R2BB30_9CILI|nr:hypothetical protein SteCoe_27219 [Stentor coeruleus]